MDILLLGYGRMGRMIEQLALAAGDRVAAAIDIDNAHELATLGKVADVAIDFSAPALLPQTTAYIQRTKTPLLSGVTGCSEAQLAALGALGAYAPVLHSANYSIGVAVFKKLLEAIASTPLMDFDIELTETHHNQKADAPSGTAKLLLAALDPQGARTPVYGREGLCGKRKPNEIGVHALRGGTVAGEHSVLFFGEDEAFELTHRAASRKIFAAGALKAARALIGKPNGRYTLEQILFGEG
ncbi:MAG: 4-hydroxy-tetrahydrodipicolinate reductase [Christensenellaceae bacterium]|jgi:4-hydroxy-tetrahydrodipicolinate reductase|nr:4-hydroxy-tetrahydrodipicolinate reductase [Christensenellaceae bacterium]